MCADIGQSNLSKRFQTTLWYGAPSLVGQRRGLGIASSERLYVVGVDHEAQTVEVGRRDALEAAGCHARDCRWLVEVPLGALRCSVRIRYRHGGVEGNVVVDGSRALVTFDEPQFAVAPGQAVVFYAGDRVLGGGWIDRAVHAHAEGGNQRSRLGE